MSNDDLRQLLAQVHERLRNTSSLDASAREMLTTVMHDIEKATELGVSRLQPFASAHSLAHPSANRVARFRRQSP